MKVWSKAIISIVIVFVSFAIIWWTKSIETSEPSTGYFVLISGGAVILVVGIGALFYSLTQLSGKVRAMGEERERKLSEFRYEIGNLLVDLFSTKPNDPNIYKTAGALVYKLREAANFLGIGKKVRDIYNSKFIERLISFRTQTDNISKHHRGGEYLHQMRKDLYDGKIDNPGMLKAAFKFLEKMRPYGDIAKTLNPLLKRVF